MKLFTIILLQLFLSQYLGLYPLVWLNAMIFTVTIFGWPAILIALFVLLWISFTAKITFNL